MNISKTFQDFIDNLKIENETEISKRYGEITAALNKRFRNTVSKTANSLQVGSYGRYTAINGISDLDMLYIMPKSKWDEYKQGGQYKLLLDTKEAIQSRYPRTKILVDRLVVSVSYQNFYIEVQPVFEQGDNSFKYPDTYNDGSWKITKPREEKQAISDSDIEKNQNLRRLCKMARAWKNNHGVGMGGLLVDTLAYNFLNLTDEYDTKSYGTYDCLSRDFFEYLANQPNQKYYAALGSGQRVRVKKKFQRKAKKAYQLCLKAIEAGETNSAYDKWKKIFGRPFPSKPKSVLDSYSISTFSEWNNTEQFIEDRFPVDIRYNLEIDCDVLQDGFKKRRLLDFLKKGFRLKHNKSLKFRVVKIDIPIADKYEIYWKVLNRGDEARRRNCIRGQIKKDSGIMRKDEHTNFRGDHFVECYAVKNGVVVAKDRIIVPIE